jgi:GDP-4-dehydro-6-deoxy-D-mannose reductase
MERGRTGEAYNIASGEAHSMHEVLQILLLSAKVKIEVREKEALVRKKETTTMRGDAGKLRGETGWNRRFTLEQSLADTLEYWRRQP